MKHSCRTCKDYKKCSSMDRALDMPCVDYKNKSGADVGRDKERREKS